MMRQVSEMFFVLAKECGCMPLNDFRCFQFGFYDSKFGPPPQASALGLLTAVRCIPERGTVSVRVTFELVAMRFLELGVCSSNETEETKERLFVWVLIVKELRWSTRNVRRSTCQYLSAKTQRRCREKSAR